MTTINKKRKAQHSPVIETKRHKLQKLDDSSQKENRSANHPTARTTHLNPKGETPKKRSHVIVIPDTPEEAKRVRIVSATLPTRSGTPHGARVRDPPAVCAGTPNGAAKVKESPAACSGTPHRATKPKESPAGRRAGKEKGAEAKDSDLLIALAIEEEEKRRVERENDDLSIARRVAKTTASVGVVPQTRYPPRSPGAFRFHINLSNLSSLVHPDEFINNYESLSSLEDVVVGVDERVLKSIGSFQYNGEKLSDKRCPICIEEFTPGDDLRNLPCGHHFHLPCIDTWLHKSKKCPLCKTLLQ